MSRKVGDKMLQTILFFSPHQATQRYHQIAAVKPLKKPVQQADQMYIQAFINRLDCEILHTNEFFHLQNRTSKLLKQTMVRQYSPTIMNEHNKSPKTQQEKALLTAIKNLSEQNSQSFTTHQQNLEIIANLTAEQAFKNKKYLIYMYKIILNRKNKPGFEQFWKEMKTVIVEKIYEGHADVMEKAKINDQLIRIERLVKARNHSANGDSDEAKANYQKLFEDDGNDQNVRMEALQYLCKKSKQKGDEGYLLGMMSKMKSEKGQQRHRKLVENTLKQLHKSRSIEDRSNQSQTQQNQ